MGEKSNQRERTEAMKNEEVLDFIVQSTIDTMDNKAAWFFLAGKMKSTIKSKQ